MCEWRAVERFPGYEISEYGELRRMVSKRRWKAGRVLGGKIHFGYRRFKLPDTTGRYKDVSAHRLVCEAWHGPRPVGKTDVAHYDGNRLNNHYTNLRWATRIENCEDARRHGSQAGENNPGSKLSASQVADIRQLYEAGGMTHKQLADMFGVCRANISFILSGKLWSTERKLVTA